DVAVGVGAGNGSFGLPSADNDNVYIGRNAGADVFAGGRNVAIGANAGKGRADDSDENVAIGNEAGLQRGGSYNIAIGKQAGGLNAESPVTGPLSTTDSVSIGREANATQDGAIAFGLQAKATGGKSLALGANARAEGGSFIALGSGSVADGAINSPTTTAFLTGTTAGSILSIGSTGPTGVTRRIVNVAGGVKNTDAVNVAQLKGAQSKVAGILGGGITVDTSGNYSDITVGGTQYSTLADAIAANGGGGGGTAIPTDVVRYHGGTGGADKLVTVDDPQSGTDAVNLQTLNEQKAHFLSVNSTPSDLNYGNAGATGTDAIAIGANTGGTGDASIVVGKGATAGKIHGIALGQDASSKGEDAAAIGYNTLADADQSVVIGYKSRVENQAGKPASIRGIAIGSVAKVTRQNATAIGPNALVESAQGQAFGHNAYVHQNADNAIAMGETAVVNEGATSAMAFGNHATVAQNATDSTAIGTQAQTSAANAYAVGTSTLASANSAYAQGNNAQATGVRAFALGSKDGNNTVAKNTNAYAIGAGAQSEAINAYAIGAHAEANKAATVGDSGRDAFAMGTNALVNEQNAYAIGKAAESTAASAYAVGDTAKSSAEDAFAVGTSAVSDKADAYAVGSNANADGVNAYALGNTAMASGQDAVAFGTNSAAAGQSSIALGKGSSATGAGINAVAVGTNSNVAGENAIAIGNGAQATAKNTLAVGTGSVVTGAGSGAFGDPNTVNATGAYVVGNDNLIDTPASNSFVLGNDVTLNQNWQANSVVLGNNSASHQVHTGTDATQVTLNGVTKTFAGPASQGNGFVSVGSAGGERQIENVAAGEISAASTDAINGSQLYATNQAVQQPISFHGDSGADVDRTLNTTLNVQGGATGSLTSDNIGVVGDGTDTLSIQLARNIDLGTVGSLKMGNNTVDQHGLTIAGGPKFTDNGISADGQQINGVAAGVNPTDAVNLSQLTTAQTDLTNKGLDFAPNAGATVHRNLGQTLDIQGGATTAGTYSDGNVKTVATANGIDIQLADNPVFTSVATGNSVLDNSGLTVDNGTSSTSYGATGLTITSGPSVTKTGIDAANTKITNLAPGTAGTDAVNYSQLNSAAAAATTEVQAGTNVASV
ncbi:MAG: hypothetical protein L0H70_04125, partial [Xanthomonadales bacterium]|nr:hypothetical protein [Xanthomonadales bacterium]